MEADDKTRNQFKLLKELEDYGPNFTLHLGKNTKREEKVHVKISKKKYMSKDEIRYNKEILALQDLNTHRNVVKFFAAWIDEFYELRIITEYLETNVSRVMKKRGRPFTELETKRIMQQVLDGLNHVHTKNYMHRSLKPDALKCDSEANIVKISDFTNALAQDVKQMVKLDVRPPHYLAPEIMLNMAYSTPVDVWAAGCIMAELLSGKPLFDGKNENDQMKKICELLGTFKRADWPRGYLEARAGNFGLPMVLQGSGLAKVGIAEKSEAGKTIYSMLTWVPEKRLSADMCLRTKFFVDETDKDDILQSTQLQLQSWAQKWEPNLDKGSIFELQNIMEGLSPRKEKQIADMFERENGEASRKSMSNQEHLFNQNGSGPQPSRGTPRQSMESSKSMALDEFMQTSRSRNDESLRNSPQKETHSHTGMQHQASSSSFNAGPIWTWNPPKRGVSPDLIDDPFRVNKGGQRRRNADNKQQRSMGGFNPIAHSLDDDHESGNSNAPKINPVTGKPLLDLHTWEQKLQSNNKIRHRNYFGDDFMRSQLGNKMTVGEKQNKQTVNEPMKMNSSPNEPKRNRKDDFHTNPYEPSWMP